MPPNSIFAPSAPRPPQPATDPPSLQNGKLSRATGSERPTRLLGSRCFLYVRGQRRPSELANASSCSPRLLRRPVRVGGLQGGGDSHEVMQRGVPSLRRMSKEAAFFIDVHESVKDPRAPGTFFLECDR